LNLSFEELRKMRLENNNVTLNLGCAGSI